MHGNQLRSLPASITECSNLKTLWVGNNAIDRLPSSIGNLKKLQELSVKNNLLVYLPPSFSSLSLYTFVHDGNPGLHIPEAEEEVVEEEVVLAPRALDVLVAFLRDV